MCDDIGGRKTTNGTKKSKGSAGKVPRQLSQTSSAIASRLRRLIETPAQKAKRLDQARLRGTIKREEETTEQTAARLTAAAFHQRIKRENETAGKKTTRLEAAASSQRIKRENETAEEKATRLTAAALQQRIKRENETAEEKTARLYADAERKRLKRAMETPEEKAARLAVRRATRPVQPFTRKCQERHRHPVTGEPMPCASDLAQHWNCMYDVSRLMFYPLSLALLPLFS